MVGSILLLLTIVGLVAWWCRPMPSVRPHRIVVLDDEPDQAAREAAAELRAIRRRLDVALYTAEVRSDAVRLRRELDNELQRGSGEWL
jgi:hypothetical protein